MITLGNEVKGLCLGWWTANVFPVWPPAQQVNQVALHFRFIQLINNLFQNEGQLGNTPISLDIKINFQF